MPTRGKIKLRGVERRLIFSKYWRELDRDERNEGGGRGKGLQSLRKKKRNYKKKGTPLSVPQGGWGLRSRTRENREKERVPSESLLWEPRQLSCPRALRTEVLYQKSVGISRKKGITPGRRDSLEKKARLN